MMPYITAFHAADSGRPAQGGSGGLCQLCLHRPVCRHCAGYGVHHRIFGAHCHGGSISLLNIDRGVPEVFNSCYDIRVLLDSTSKMMDGRKVTDLKLPFALSMSGQGSSKGPRHHCGGIASTLPFDLTDRRPLPKFLYKGAGPHMGPGAPLHRNISGRGTPSRLRW